MALRAHRITHSRPLNNKWYKYTKKDTGLKMSNLRAVEYAREILQTEAAINTTLSDKLRRSLRQTAHKKRAELLYYCKCLGLSVKETYRLAKE